MNTQAIIRCTERLYTLVKRASVSTNRDDHREAIMARFSDLASDLGKLVTVMGRPDWQRVHLQLVDLHSAAVHADEARTGTFAHIGSETALLTSLHAFAATLGFTLSDAATADTTPEDEIARRYAEGHMQEARDAAE